MTERRLAAIELKLPSLSPFGPSGADMAEQRVERWLAAVLAADVAGYSRLMGADEEGTLARLNAHRREFLEPTVAEHNGRIVKRTGDGLLIEFGSAVDATRCAIQTQRGMAQRNKDVQAERRIEIRIGIHLGDIIIEDGDILGDGVNIAARMESISEPGSICISDDTFRQVRGKIDVAFEYRAAGKGLPDPTGRDRSQGLEDVGTIRSAINRRPSVPKHERRYRPRIFCRWYR